MDSNEKNSKANEAYGDTFKKLSNFNPVKREELLKKYPAEKIAKVWEVFCKLIAKNYQSGKGTVIHKFGIFTFDNAELNMEGTTNVHLRDLKPRKPVFLISSDFVDNVRQGIYATNGIVYYKLKKNNSTGTVKLNYAELSYSLSMGKDDCVVILENLIKFIGDSIISNTFKNKEMPGLGILMLKSNIVAVKFNDDLIENIKLVPNKLSQTKKQVNLFMEANEKNNENLNQTSKGGSGINLNLNNNNLPNLANSMQKLRPKTYIYL